MPDQENDLERQHRLDVEAMMKERDAREAARKPQIRRSNAGVVSVMPAASSEVERPQTVAQREAEHVAKYVPPAWATGGDINGAVESARGAVDRLAGPVDKYLPKADPAVDEKINDAKYRTFNPEWADRVSKRAAEALKGVTPEGIRGRLRDATEGLAQRIDPGIVTRRQDREIAEQREIIRRLTLLRDKQLPEQEPRDGGEIDEPEPQVRQPVQQEREFTDPEAKARYIELIRKAQENAKK